MTLPAALTGIIVVGFFVACWATCITFTALYLYENRRKHRAIADTRRINEEAHRIRLAIADLEGRRSRKENSQ